MAYYAKLFNNIGSISATYKNADGADETVVIRGGGAVTLVPFQVLSLPGVVAAHVAGNLKVYSDQAATAEITTLPNSTVSPATTTVAGVVKRTPAIADLAGGADLPTTVTKVNALLAALRTAGVVTP